MLLIILVCVCSHLALIRLLVSARRGLTQVANIIVAESNSGLCECVSASNGGGWWSGATPSVSAILPVQSESARVPLFAPALLSGGTTVRTGEGHAQ